MFQKRRVSREFRVGNVGIGGSNPVSIQSMTNTPTSDTAATLAQIRSLAALGCQIIRCSVDNDTDAAALGRIMEESPIPVVADIQFDYRSALAAIANHASALRLNPGLISDEEHLAEVAAAAVKADIPIRVGANSGSIRRQLLKQKMDNGMDFAGAMAETLVESVLAQCEALENHGVRKIKVAMKSSDTRITVAANRVFADRSDLPLHLGVTEAGLPSCGSIKSAVGIGALLLDGIGDTIRVSLTAPPEEEVLAARRILEACGLRDARPAIVSCPTCGRTEIDLPGLAARVEALVAEIKASGREIPLNKIAVMGCPVNGPGEARDADIGLAGSRNGEVVIFRQGKTVGAFEAEKGFEFLKNEILNSL